MFCQRSTMSQGKPMIETPMARVARIARTVTQLLNLMGYLASPKLIAKFPAVLSPNHLLEHIDGYLAVIEETRGSTDGGFTKTESHALKLRELCVQWQDPAVVPKEMTLAARDLFEAFGLGEPPEGWDSYEGHPDE